MDIKEAHRYQKWCNDNEILIYPIPVYDKSESYKICVERNGVSSVGQLIFENQPKGKSNSIWDQIRELYKIIYQRENKN